MSCYKPLHAWQKPGGGVTWKRRDSLGIEVTIPCGGCIGCRIARSREWAVRCMHEASMHQDNCFITLTYDEDHIPYDHGLRKDHFQKFMKRLRKKYHWHKIRYYMCGEYGTSETGGLGRPHFHALIFGFDFADKIFWEERRGSKLYRSPTLENLWPFGYSRIGSVNFGTAAYVARYVMKKITGNMAEDHYQRVDAETGEIYPIIPEYNAMSLKPGIAKDWFDKYSSDVFPHDYVIVNGRKVRTPAYYLKELKKIDPDMFEDVKGNRKEYAIKQQANNTPERLEARETVAKTKLRSLERPLQ